MVYTMYGTSLNKVQVQFSYITINYIYIYSDNITYMYEHVNRFQITCRHHNPKVAYL